MPAWAGIFLFNIIFFLSVHLVVIRIEPKNTESSTLNLRLKFKSLKPYLKLTVTNLLLGNDCGYKPRYSVLINSLNRVIIWGSAFSAIAMISLMFTGFKSSGSHSSVNTETAAVFNFK
ncbi:hypothetical protein SAMN04487990_11137 [Bizionia paragorgiae]|uniref:Uncharacterized protein n=1 Tax=Bizionia paragorgiae TaxID=283786 RepID=A0A1H4AKQ1_BIZPA|nr:hypothetical protein SAMN04487990_11137 [Bizionia paragorgiae]